MTQPELTNRLAAEKSPYLRQHAHNPVDWFPWGEEALARAKAEDRPIFLSIGYSTCHWCHVMERESFEDPEIAAILNQHYVPIKVDREERPDVDRIYMTAVQAMTGGGGWPLSAWLTPDLEPYYAGTYFPPRQRYGTPGFGELLVHLARAWSEQREKVLQSAQRVSEVLRRVAAGPDDDQDDTPEDEGDGSLEPLARAVHNAFARYRQGYDAEHGGFDDAPKFPRPTVFCFLLRHALFEGEEMAREMALHSLQEIWAGGIHDHLGGGYHRYSVDRCWRVPHFEKMLYDQAQLVWAFLDAFQLGRDPIFAAAARDTLDYVAHDLAAPEGGFYSAEDADSEPVDNATESSEGSPHTTRHKQEGAFYLWSDTEIEQLLGNEDAAVVCSTYGVSAGGNTIADPHGELGQRNVLYAALAPENVAEALGIEARAVGEALQRGRAKLLAARNRRPRPERDNKIITAWNGLMLSAFARGAALLDEPSYRERAEAAALFLLEHCRKHAEDGTSVLYRRWCDGEPAHAAQLDDYAALACGLIDLHQVAGEARWLLEAAELVGAALERFDDGSGGFFDSPAGDPSLLVRSRELYDGAEPSGTALLCHALVRLGRILDRPEWVERAERAIRAAAPLLRRQPEGMPHLLCVMQLLRDAGTTVYVAGEQPEALTALANTVWQAPLDPRRELVLLGADAAVLRKQVAFFEQLKAPEHGARAWLCRDRRCELPTEDANTLREALAR